LTERGPCAVEDPCLVIDDDRYVVVGEVVEIDRDPAVCRIVGRLDRRLR
jgi:hypothetical protein